MASFNAFPIKVESLLGAHLQAQLDENGLVATGANVDSNAVVASLGQMESDVALQIEETVSGNKWSSMLTSRMLSMGRLVSNVQSYFFQVSATSLIWRDTTGKATTLSFDEGSTALAFDSPSTYINAGGNRLLASIDSTRMTVGNGNQSLIINSSVDGIGISTPLNLRSKLTDKNASAGNVGQVLTTTGDGVQWQNNGTGAVNVVDTKSFASTVVTNTPLQLQSSTLAAGSYLVQYSVALTFAPSAGAGIQETFMRCGVSNDGSTLQATSADTTVRNIVGGASTFYMQSSAVVAVTEGHTFGTIHVIYSGGLGAPVSAVATMTSTLVNA